MKIKTGVFMLLFACSWATFAQSRVSISGLVGYTLQNNLYFDNSYYGYIEDCAQYGGVLEFMLRPTVSMGVSYMHMDTRTPIYDSYRDQVNSGGYDATALNYLMFEGTKYFGIGGALSGITPYAGIGVGMSTINVKNGDSYTKFAWDGKLGIKIRLTRNISVLGQMLVQSIVQGVGGSMYVGTGGAGVAISTYSSVYQFSFGGGLSLNL